MSQSDLKIGIGSYTYPWAVGIPGYPQPKDSYKASDLLQKARELEVPVVQICDNLPLHNLSRDAVSELKDLSSGLVMEIGTRGTEPRRLEVYLELAIHLDARLVRTLLGSPGNPFTESELKKAKDSLGKILPRFEDAGIMLALENYEGATCHDLAELIEELDSPSLGVCLDTVNSLGALESPRQVVDILGPNTANLHVKDFVIERADHKLGFSVTGCPLGEGLLDLPWILQRLAEFGRYPHLILEQWVPYPCDIRRALHMEDKWAKKGVEYLKGIVDRIGDQQVIDPFSKGE